MADFSACPQRTSIVDLEELIAHDERGCEACNGAKAGRGGGDAAPSSASGGNKQPEQMETSEPTEKSPPPKGPQKFANNAGREKKQQHIHQALRTIRTEKGVSKGLAAVQLIDARRAENAGEKKAERTEVARKDMPFVPHTIRLPLNERGEVPMSCFPFDKHKRYVAIISNLLRDDRGFRFELNKLELKGYDELLADERRFFETECLKKCDEMGTNPYSFYKPQFHQLYKSRMLERASMWPTGGFQKLVHSSPWFFNDHDAAVRQSLPSVSSALNAGHTPKIALPEPRRKCDLPMDGAFVERKLSLNKDPIEDDEPAAQFAMSNEIGVVMSASTLRNLLTMPWVNRDVNFATKVSVRRELMDGRFRSYVVFSKPVLASALSNPTLCRQFQKWALKAAVLRENVQRSAKRKPAAMDVDEPQTKRGRPAEAEEFGVPKARPAAAADDEEAALEIVEEEPPEEDGKKTAEAKPEPANSSGFTMDIDSFLTGTGAFDNLFGAAPAAPPAALALAAVPKPASKSAPKAATSSAKPASPKKPPKKAPQEDDLLGDILKGMGDGKREEMVDVKKDAFLSSTHRYAVVELVLKGQPANKILVRSSNHGVDDQNEHVTLSVKPDYLPSIGAERLCEEELLWNYFTAFFKGSQTHVQVRVHPATFDVLQVERRTTARMYATFTQETRHLISQRTQRLADLLDRIGKLEPGEYLLRHSAEQMDLLSQTIEDPNEPVWNRAHVKELLEAYRLPLSKPSEMWKGLDPHTPLVWHIVTSRAPGTLMPLREGIRVPKPRDPNAPNGQHRRRNRGNPQRRWNRNERQDGREEMAAE